eukprot:scaffold216995_cov28-Tisochrysis_lutea.AAC.3
MPDCYLHGESEKLMLAMRISMTMPFSLRAIEHAHSCYGRSCPRTPTLSICTSTLILRPWKVHGLDDTLFALCQAV